MDWQEQRVLITGATGFIGSRLTRRVLKTGAEVWAGVYPDDDPGRASSLPAQVRQTQLDVVSPSSVFSAVAAASPTVVIHLAAAGVAEGGINAATALAVNGGGAVNLLEAVRGRPVSRVVLVGTCHEYGDLATEASLDPFNAYAASKVAAWAFGRAFWRKHGLPVVTVRPFQVYGPGQPAHTLIPGAISAAVSGEDFAMTGGEQERDFTYVDDVVEGILAAALSPGIDGQSVDLGTGVALSVRRVVETIWRMTRGEGNICLGAIPHRRGEASRLCADADRTARLTGWRATTTLDDGLRKTIDEFSASLAR